MPHLHAAQQHCCAWGHPHAPPSPPWRRGRRLHVHRQRLCGSIWRPGHHPRHHHHPARRFGSAARRAHGAVLAMPGSHARGPARPPSWLTARPTLVLPAPSRSLHPKLLPVRRRLPRGARRRRAAAGGQCGPAGHPGLLQHRRHRCSSACPALPCFGSSRSSREGWCNAFTAPRSRTLLRLHPCALQALWAPRLWLAPAAPRPRPPRAVRPLVSRPPASKPVGSRAPGQRRARVLPLPPPRAPRCVRLGGAQGLLPLPLLLSTSCIAGRDHPHLPCAPPPPLSSQAGHQHSILFRLLHRPRQRKLHRRCRRRPGRRGWVAGRLGWPAPSGLGARQSGLSMPARL